MKISDELRLWCDDADADNIACDDLRELADRIDDETVELPRSADGKIWTGREVCFWTGAMQDDLHTFDSICLSNGKWSVEDTSYRMYAASSVWYERPDSWERIAYDIEMVVPIDDDDDERLRHELADRIRRLAAKEDK